MALSITTDGEQVIIDATVDQSNIATVSLTVNS